MDAEKGELNQPKDEKGHHAIGRDALGLGNPIRQVQVAGPDGAEHDAHSIATVDILNRKPEDSQNHTRDNRNI